MPNKPKRGDTLKWTTGNRVTVRATRKQGGDTYYIFHELTCEYSFSQLRELGVIGNAPADKINEIKNPDC